MINTRKASKVKMQPRDWVILGTILMIVATNLIWYNYSLGQDVVNQYNQSAIEQLQSEIDTLKR